MRISEKLLQLRKQNNLSQEDLANQLFITRQSVSLWEKGETVPSIDNLIMLKNLYGISIDEWVSDCDSETEPPKDACTADEKNVSVPQKKNAEKENDTPDMCGGIVSGNYNGRNNQPCFEV